MELSQILTFAIKHGACSAELNKFKEFIESGDTLSAWQTVQGNIEWLKGENKLRITHKELEEKSGGVGKTWYENGQQFSETNYKNGKLNGLCRYWYAGGQLWAEENHKNGKLDGLYRQWYGGGQLCREANYKNGKYIFS